MHFCDDDSHNRYAPTKHNQICNRRNVHDVILRHSDFVSQYHMSPEWSDQDISAMLTFTYKKRSSTRYILILDETQDTMVRESWTFLRLAIRNWVVYDLPANTEVGVLLANDTGTSRQFDLSTLAQEKNRNLIASFIPFAPGESQKPACMSCAIRDAQMMLERQTRTHGAASSIILIIAPGMDVKTDYSSLSEAAKKQKIRIATINYPGVIHRKPLDALAKLTSGLQYTLFESKQNSERSYLTTYFDLVNMLHHIMIEYYEGNRLDLPVEIHRKKLLDINDDQSPKRRTISGTFLLDDTMGAPSSFLLYTHSTEFPLINSVQVNSPSGMKYIKRSDERLSVKQLSIEAQINETGSWTYTIDRFNGSPQPHFIQVTATAAIHRSALTVKAWIEQKYSASADNYGPLTIYVEVKKGLLPVNEALVEMTVRRPDLQCDMPAKCEQTLRILDTGSGDPDITRGDGIYTRYFNPVVSGAGIYQFDIQVTDNGNTAYSLPDGYNADFGDLADTKCCGSFVPHPSKQPMPSFQRILPALTVFVSELQIQSTIIDGVGNIGDLRVESADTTKVRLSWTAPDIGGLNVAHYEVRYAFNAQHIVDSFDTALLWEHDSPLAFSIGDHTAFTMNISAEPSLIGKTMFIAVRPFVRLVNSTRAVAVSNYVHVYLKPNPPIPIEGTNTPNAQQPPSDGYNSSGDDSLYYSGDVEWVVVVLIIVAIALIFIVCFAAFCYFCLAKRCHRNNEKSPKRSMCDKFSKQSKVEKLDATPSNNLITSLSNGNSIHQVPSPSPPKQDYVYQGQDQFDHSAYIICPTGIPDPHTVGLPLYQSDDDINQQQKYAMVQDLENEYKQENPMFYRPYETTGSTEYALSSTTLPGSEHQQILSPYQSWTASQLLHEHERRHSTLDDMLHPIDHTMAMDHNMHHNNDNISLIQNVYHKGDRLSMADTQMPAGVMNVMIDSSSINSPPVPPLPYTTNSSGYPMHYQIYSSAYRGTAQTPSMGNYSTVMRNNEPSSHAQKSNLINNTGTSLQGSLCSVHSGNDMRKKTRTITMVWIPVGHQPSTIETLDSKEILKPF